MIGTGCEISMKCGLISALNETSSIEYQKKFCYGKDSANCRYKIASEQIKTLEKRLNVKGGTIKLQELGLNFLS